MIARERGLVLVVVLWVSALLTLLAGSFTFGVQTESRLATFYRHQVEARAVAQAAVTFFGALLADEAARSELPLNGLPLTWGFEGREVSIRIIDASGLVDLNQAPRDLLLRAVAWAGVPPGSEDVVVDSLLDWRDTDNLRSLNGAEDDDYLVAGIVAGAKDEEFEAVEEVGQVLGISSEVAKRLAAVSTVHGTANINPDAAPDEVLALLDDESGTGEAGTAPAPRWQGINVYHLLVEVRVLAGEIYSFSAVVDPDIAGSQVLAWRE